jgi:phosphate transport system substrate-binding protein
MQKLIITLTAILVSLGAARVAEAQAKVVKVDGSSTVFPITEGIAEEFQKENRGTNVTVGVSGTGGGFKKFVRGEIDISDASRPISVKEMADAKAAGIGFIELPIAFDALTVVVNPKNDWVKTLTVEDLKKIWSPDAQEKVKKWNQVRPEWPDAPLTLYGPGADSGTFDYFTEAVVGKAKSSRGDYTASEDDNVLVQGVSNDKNALGYFGYAYYAENKDKLKAVPIEHDGKAVGPSEQTVVDGTYVPLSRPIFIYVNKKSLEKPEVKAFVEYYLKNAAEMSKAVNYIPLPESAYASASKRLSEQQTGTAFGGHALVGLHINELFKRELKH